MNELMDELDIASELEMEQREAAIEEARKPPEHAPKYTGVCVLCQEALPSPRRFCDAFCRDRWEGEAAAAIRNEGPCPLREEPFDDSTSA